MKFSTDCGANKSFSTAPTDAERIAALEDELAGARFAAESHLNTVKLQKTIIERMVAESSQPILSAVVASEIKPACYRVDWSSNEPAGAMLLVAMKAEIADLREQAQLFTNLFKTEQFPNGDDEKLSIHEVGSVAQPVAAIPEATEMVTLESAQHVGDTITAWRGLTEQSK